MDAAEPSSKRAGLAGRAAGMLFRPETTLQAAAAEPTTVAELFRGYVLPLAAVPAVCGAIGLLVFGAGIPRIGVQLPTSPLDTLVGAGLAYVLSLLAVYLLALFVSLIAPLFGGVSSHAQAMKLVAYSATAAWLAGVFGLYPTLGFPLAILGGLYSLYALFLGLEPLMQVPRARTLTCFAAVLVVAVLISVALRLATGLVV